MLNVVIVIDGFQHGSGNFQVTKCTIVYMTKQNWKSHTKFFATPPPISAQEMITYRFQTKLHGLQPGQSNAEPQHSVRPWLHGYLDSLETMYGAVRVWTKGITSARVLEALSGKVISNLEDLAPPCPSLKGRKLSQEDKALVYALELESYIAVRSFMAKYRPDNYTSDKSTQFGRDVFLGPTD